MLLLFTLAELHFIVPPVFIYYISDYNIKFVTCYFILLKHLRFFPHSLSHPALECINVFWCSLVQHPFIRQRQPSSRHMQLYYCYNNSYLSTNTLKTLQVTAKDWVPNGDFYHLNILKFFIILNILKFKHSEMFKTSIQQSCSLCILGKRDWRQNFLILSLFCLIKCHNSLI